MYAAAVYCVVIIYVMFFGSIICRAIWCYREARREKQHDHDMIELMYEEEMKRRSGEG